MKKIFHSINIALLISVVLSAIFGVVREKTWLIILASVLIFVIAILNVLYVYNFKERKNLISSILIVGGVALAVLSNVFIVKSVIAFYVLFSFSELCFVLALVFNLKFSKCDVFYMLATVIPMLLLINLAPIFGFSGVFNRILVSVFIAIVATLFGLAISHLIRRQNPFNIAFSIVAFINLIYALGVIILKQSNVTHKIQPIVSVAFYILMLMTVSLILFIRVDRQKSSVSIKRNVIYSVSILLVAFLFGYTLVSNCLAFNLFSAKIYKEQFLSMVENNLNIPIIEINTQENEMPKNKEDYVNCSFEISNCDEEKDNFSVPMAKNYEDEGCVGIRLRGNSTKKARKQPYRIKFDEKQSFFGLKANKSWVLLADFFDQSYIRNYTAFTLANKFEAMDIKEEQEFVPTPHHVALIINNEFKGLYLLCEQMDEKKGRANVDEDFDVNVDKNFPFFVEMDVAAFKEGETGVDNFYVPTAENHVEIKYPESDERGATADSDKVYDYIYEYINAVFTIIKTGEKVKVSFREELVGLTDLVDLKSAADYYLINEIMMNIDSAYKSIYLHKTKDGLMEFGPIWDFDLSLTTELKAPFKKSYIEGSEDLFIAKNSSVFKYLIQNEDFFNLVASRYNSKKSAIIDTYEFMKDYKAVIDSVAVIDSKMWHGTTGEFQFDMQYDYVRLFLMDRYNYLNDVFSKPHSEFLALI